MAGGRPGCVWMGGCGEGINDYDAETSACIDFK